MVRAVSSFRVRAAAGTLALAASVIALLLLGASAASRASSLVPASRQAGLPGWLAGPEQWLGIAPSRTLTDVLLIAMLIAWGVALACAGALGTRRLWTAIVLAHLAAVLAPPLFSQDLFGYLAFAHLGALHGLDPYTHAAAAAPHDAVYRFIGWQHARSPYGPLFTLASYALAPLSVAAGVWLLKAVAAIASLATIAVVWRVAERLGRSPKHAVALFALNPVVLAFAVAGGHNDLLLGLLVAAGIALRLLDRGPASGGTLALAAGVKVSAILALPFALLGAERRRTGLRDAAWATVVLLGVAALALVAFGAHAGAVIDTLRGQQQLVAVHSIPSELSRLFGGASRPSNAVRTCFDAALAVAIAAALWHAWRRADRWLEAYGWATLAVLLSTTWLLPWYGTWLLVPAAFSADRRLRAACVVLSVYLVATRLPLAAGVLG